MIKPLIAENPPAMAKSTCQLKLSTWKNRYPNIFPKFAFVDQNPNNADSFFEQY